MENQEQLIKHLGNDDYLFLYVEDGVILHHVYCDHKRAKNWCGILTGKNAANLDMIFVDIDFKKIYTSDLKVGQAIEIGGDHITRGGNRYPDRRSFVIMDITKEGLILRKFPTRAQAMKHRFEVEA